MRVLIQRAGYTDRLRPGSEGARGITEREGGGGKREREVRTVSRERLREEAARGIAIRSRRVEIDNCTVTMLELQMSE